MLQWHVEQMARSYIEVLVHLRASSGPGTKRRRDSVSAIVRAFSRLTLDKFNMNFIRVVREMMRQKIKTPAKDPCINKVTSRLEVQYLRGVIPEVWMLPITDKFVEYTAHICKAFKKDFPDYTGGLDSKDAHDSKIKNEKGKIVLHWLPSYDEVETHLKILCTDASYATKRHTGSEQPSVE